jgi:hypothetical protein
MRSEGRPNFPTGHSYGFGRLGSLQTSYPSIRAFEEPAVPVGLAARPSTWAKFPTLSGIGYANPQHARLLPTHFITLKPIEGGGSSPADLGRERGERQRDE